ncbi:MAG TPA: hypothetical protein VMB19_05805 [Silvibacterium sp.]|nr:hypothetical protein [Silvibacterium sp.]
MPLNGGQMFGSFILDVAIGMVFIYLLLSLVASGVNEILASIVQSRAANLQRGLHSLFSGDSIEAGSLSLVDNLYNHGLIRGLYPDPAMDLNDNRPLGWLSKLRLWLQKRVGVAPGKDVAGIQNPLLLPSYIPARTFALAMIDILNKDKFNGKTAIQNIEDFLSSHQQQFAKNKAAQAMLALVIDAQNDVKDEAKRLQKLQSNLEDWYNDAMDRVSGWYKRYTQKVLMTVGLVLAIVFNVNSITIAHLLWVDRDIRDGMVSAATDYLKSHPNGPVLANQAGESSGAISSRELVARMESSVKAVDEVTNKYMLPVGWRYSWRDYLWGWENRTRHMTLMALVTLAGWLITAGALSLGASFWFDMLNKIMVVRNTVKPQEKSTTEGSKD